MIFIVLCAISFYYINIKRYINMVDNLVINFIVKESSILIFIIKTVSISLILIILSILLNQHSYNNKKERNYGYITIIACIGIFIILNNFSYGTTISSTMMIDEAVVENEIYADEIYKFNRSEAKNEYQIELNELINSENIKIYLAEKDKHNFSIRHYNFSSKANENVIVHFIPNKNNINGIDVASYMNPQLAIRYINNEIHLKVLYKKDVQVIFMEPYSMLKQFEFLKDKGILKEFYGNRNEKIPGKIIFYAPEDVSMKIVD